MRLAEFKSQIDSKNSCIFCLFYGEETPLAEEGLKYLVDKYVSQPSLNLAKFSDEGVDVETVLASLEIFPFMDEKRITVVKEFYPKEEQLKKLKNYVANANTTSVLVVINKKKYDPLSKISGATLIECERQTSQALARYIKAKCQEQGVEIDLENAKTIAENCLCDLTLINNEVEKLCAYSHDEGVITKDEIDLLCVKGQDSKIYQMTDYIARKQFDKALSIIDEMLSRGETPQRIINSIFNYFRRLLHVSISDLSDAELSRIFEVKESAIKITRQQSEKFKRKALKQAVDNIIDADFRYKSGKANVDQEMWLTIFNIMIK